MVSSILYLEDGCRSTVVLVLYDNRETNESLCVMYVIYLSLCFFII